MTGLNQLPALQRVFLSHNSISRLEDVRCLFEVSYLIELSLDGNPISDNSSSSSDSNDPNKYRAQLVVGMPGLRHLDLKRITEEERASASALLNSTAGSGHDRDGSNNSSISGGNATRYHQQGKGGDESPHDGLHTGQQLVLSDYGRVCFAHQYSYMVVAILYSQFLTLRLTNLQMRAVWTTERLRDTPAMTEKGQWLRLAARAPSTPTLEAGTTERLLITKPAVAAAPLVRRPVLAQ